VKVEWQKRLFFDHSFVKKEPLAFHWKTIQKECVVAFSPHPDFVNLKTFQLFALDAICKKACKTSAFMRHPITITDLTCEVVKTRDVMSARKLRLEVFDSQGNRYTITCEGSVNREKVLRLLDLVELVGATGDEDEGWRRTSLANTKFEKIRAIIEQHFPHEWFSSQDAKKACGQVLSEPLSLSTISTYLARLADRGFLLRKGSSNQRRYKILALPLHDKTNIIKGR
jgi:hypothetical protein